jgi:alcohol dehydrogenase YqhD (iron-dependent ADH family)
MKYVLNENTVGKFVEYGVNVWGIDAGLDRFEIANRAIAETAAFFKKLGIPATLREVGIGGENLEVMARKSVACMSNGFVPLRAEDVLAIFRAAL